MRLAHLVSHPIPYQAPLYRELSARPGVDLTVYFYSDASVRGYHDVEFDRTVRWRTPLLEGYRSRFLPSAVRTGLQRPYGEPPNWDVVAEVFGEGYDAVWIHVYAHANAWLVAALAPLRRTRVLIRDEQTLLHPRPWYKGALKQVALPALYARAYALYIGEQNRRYVMRYGASEDRLFSAPYCVDNAFFRARARELAPRRNDLRKRFAIESDAPIILYVGKLIPKKAPFVLLEAFRRLRSKRPCALLMVGAGELRPAIETLVTERSIRDVHLTGFLDQDEIATAYAAADIFCLPSVLHETWGLVVNEAMNFELPVVVTDKVGCAVDLVREGENGFVVPAGSPEHLANALEYLVADESVRRSFGRRSAEIVAGYSIAACADGIVAACLA